MAVRELISHPSPVFSVPAEIVEEDEFRRARIYATDMYDTLKHVNAEDPVEIHFTLSAQMIGISKRIILYLDENDKVIVMINPTYAVLSPETEGELEYFDLASGLKRTIEGPRALKIVYFTLKKERRTLLVAGSLAVVLYKELKTLDGGRYHFYNKHRYI